MLARSILYAVAASSLLSRAMSTAVYKKLYILRYDYVANMSNRRGPFRTEHLKRAVDAKQDGYIVMGGALVNPLDAGVFIFNVADKEVIETFVKEDPYVLNDLVTSYTIREWTVVV